MLQKVWIKDVRNLSDLLFDLNQKQHCYIYGGNNQGKTSILEAIYLASKQYSPIQSDISDILKISKNENRDLTSLIIDSAKNKKELEQLIRDFSIFS